MAKICIDPGHGGKDPGATGYGRNEKDDVLKMALRVGEILAANGHTIYYTRTNDIYESVNQKAREANTFGADFFASFHRNAAGASALGFETLVYSNAGKAKVCADKANASMASLGFRNRGTKIRTDLAVLNGTTMPAVLFEIGFITNTGDNGLFDSKFEQIAQGLASAIAAAVGSNISDVPASNTGSFAGGSTSTGSSSSATDSEIVFTYAVRAGGKIWSEVKNLSDWAGKGDGTPITGIAIKVNIGSVKYRVHIKGGKWLGWVTGYDWNDYNNGWAGLNTGAEIDAIQVYYNTPADYAKAHGYKKAKYRVSPEGSDGFYSWQYDTDDTGGQDGYAGLIGKSIDKFQLTVG